MLSLRLEAWCVDSRHQLEEARLARGFDQVAGEARPERFLAPDPWPGSRSRPWTRGVPRRGSGAKGGVPAGALTPCEYRGRQGA